MNERIRQLAHEAGIYKLNLSDETEYWIMEKFAELIVRQCAGIAHGSDMPSVDIKYYFGVEE